MEVDSMHALIEKQINQVKTVYSPREYSLIIQTARHSPRGYHTTVLQFDDFKCGFLDTYVTSIRPGKRARDPVVTQIRMLYYSSDTIKYSLTFNQEDFHAIPQRIRPNPVVEFSPMFESRLAYFKAQIQRFTRSETSNST